MKTKLSHIANSGLSAIVGLSLITACGVRQIEDNSTTSSSGGNRNNTVYDDDSGRASDWDRYCSKAIFFTNKGSIESALQKYFFSTLNGVPKFPGEVLKLKPPANWCLRISEGGQRAAFRIEYEDHYGGDWYEMDAIKSSNLNTASTQPILFHSSVANDKIDLIFLDSQGFTQIVGTKGGDGEYTATLRFANLPSQENYIAAYIQEQTTKCKNGTYSVAHCLGYYDPRVPAQQPQDNLAMARAMLEGGSGAEIGTIGTMRFRLSDVLY